MKISILGSIVCLITTLSVQAQVYNPTFKSSSNPNCQIMQIGLTDSLTYVFCKCNSPLSDDNRLFINDGSYIKEPQSTNTYKLISSANIPYSPAYHSFTKENSILYFALIYKAIPRDLNEIDIVSEAFDFRGVSLLNNANNSNKIDYLSLLESTPVKEKGFFYKEGKVVQYYIHKGLTVAMELEVSNSYGKYYTPYISLENYTSKRFDFFPENIQVVFSDTKIPEKALSHASYMDKVSRRQNWNTFFVALGDFADASTAGFSSSQSFTSGSYGGSSGYLSENVRTYSNFSSTTSTSSYDAGASYYARQNAKTAVSNFANKQYSIRESINQGYLKTNTVFPLQRLNGFVNFSYRNSNQTVIVVPANGDEYSFNWPLQLSYKEIVAKKTNEQNLIDSVMINCKFSEEKYRNFDSVNVGDLVKYLTLSGGDVIGIVTSKLGRKLVTFTSFTSSGQAMYWEERYSELIHILY